MVNGRRNPTKSLGTTSVNLNIKPVKSFLTWMVTTPKLIFWLITLNAYITIHIFKGHWEIFSISTFMALLAIRWTNGHCWYHLTCQCSHFVDYLCFTEDFSARCALYFPATFPSRDIVSELSQCPSIIMEPTQMIRMIKACRQTDNLVFYSLYRYLSCPFAIYCVNLWCILKS